MHAPSDFSAGWPRTADRPGFVSVNIVPGQLAARGAAAQMLASIAAAGLRHQVADSSADASGIGLGWSN